MRIIAYCVGISLLLGAVACGGKDDGGGPTGDAGATGLGGSGGGPVQGSGGTGGGAVHNGSGGRVLGGSGGSLPNVGGALPGTGAVPGSGGTQPQVGGSGGASPETGGTSGGGMNSGLPADAQLQDLTQDQVQQLVDALAGSVEAMQEGTCKMGGVFAAMFLEGDDTALQAACTQSYDECLASEPEPTEGGDVSTDGLAGCTATVGEYESCVDASVVAFNQTMAELPDCSEVTAASLAAVDFGSSPQDPAECSSVQQKCPSLIGN